MLEHKLDGFGLLGNGNRKGADRFTRVTTLSKNKGSVDKTISPLHPPKKRNGKILPVYHSLPIYLQASVKPILAIASVHSDVPNCICDGSFYIRLYPGMLAIAHVWFEMP